ncbi:MAG: hypothetical protein M3384_03315 [Acidobacteriota bacterium]|nr:hypothetical protein [Acidobacteriota bacterium]
MQSPQKEWFVESQGQVFEADFEELKQWIAEGAVLPSDKVKRGNLRWLSAEKVPELYTFFNSADFKFEPLLTTATATGLPKFKDESCQSQFFFDGSPDESFTQAEDDNFCFTHRDSEAVYACDVCQRYFCKICPNSYGSVKLCPSCGGLCRLKSEQASIHKSIGAINKPYVKIEADINGGNQNQSPQYGFSVSDAVASAFYRNPLILALAAVVFTLILSAAYFVLLPK